MRPIAQDRRQGKRGAPRIVEAVVQRREAEAHDIRSAKVDDDSALDQRLGNTPGLGMAETDLAAPPRGGTRCRKLEGARQQRFVRKAGQEVVGQGQRFTASDTSSKTCSAARSATMLSTGGVPAWKRATPGADTYAGSKAKGWRWPSQPASGDCAAC